MRFATKLIAMTRWGTARPPHRQRQPIERMIHDQALLNHGEYGLAWDAGFLPVGANASPSLTRKLLYG